MHCASMVAAQTASREEIRAHGAPAVSPLTIENRVLATGLRSRVPLAKRGYSGIVKESTGEWNGALLVFSDESRFCNVCESWTYKCKA